MDLGPRQRVKLNELEADQENADEESDDSNEWVARSLCIFFSNLKLQIGNNGCSQAEKEAVWRV